MLYSRLLERFFSFQRIPVKAIVVTALASYLLQITGIIRDDPLYLIALYTLLPWLPIVFLEGIWKVEHYTWMAVFGILAVVQIGHFAEHVIQVAQIEVFDGSLACPPPVDNVENATRAVDAGLREASHQATGASTQWVLQPGPDGLPALDANGNPVRGPAACGVFGQLDLEGVHLGWELIGWLGTLFLLTRFRRNVGLWLAAGFLSWHALENLSISWMFYLDRDAVYEGTRQVWATVADGNIVTAHPVGLLPAEVNFYEAGGKNGILARGGLFETLFGISGVMPTRPHSPASFTKSDRSTTSTWLSPCLPSAMKNSSKRRRRWRTGVTGTARRSFARATSPITSISLQRERCWSTGWESKAKRRRSGASEREATSVKSACCTEDGGRRM
jgi:hypothetical protein